MAGAVGTPEAGGHRWVYSVEELKDRLPILYVAAELGIRANEENKALCPLHDDSDPSMHFKVDEEGGDWWVCSPCGTGGDVLKLIRDVEGLDFPTTIVRASEMLDELPEGWERNPEGREPNHVPDAAWEARLAECQERSRGHAAHGLTAYAYGFITGEEDAAVKAAWDAQLLAWGWGLDEAGRVVIPHRDARGALTAVKVRPRRRGWRCYGSLAQPYGSWRPQRHDAVLLCEGESDCVWADGQRQAVDCLALPSGARGARNDWISQLRGWTRVYLAFDADESGERATSSWAWALDGRPPTDVVQLPPGTDLRSAGRPLADLLAAARPHTGLRM